MTRRSEFWVKILIASSFLIGCLILIGLFISSENQSKSNAVNLGLTTMMSMTVILGILSDSIPNAKELPVLGYFVLYEIVIIELAVVSVIYIGGMSKNMKRIARRLGVGKRTKIAEEAETGTFEEEKRIDASPRVRRRVMHWCQSVCNIRSILFAIFLTLHFADLIYALSHYH